MPELPEVETTRRGILPAVGRTVRKVVLRVPALRWPVPADLESALVGQSLRGVERRAKYLLLRFDTGTVILHLGMSGYLRLVRGESPLKKHDHIDLLFTDGSALRLNDSRRFGAFLWTGDAPMDHPLLVEMGPEPVAGSLDGDYLFQKARGRRVAVKPFIMDQKIVVGVGNIYASEALHRAGIHPLREAGRISRNRYEKLVLAIGEVIQEAIAAGGTTIRDFQVGEGKPGYFRQQLRVYGRDGKPCLGCGRAIRQMRQGQRSTYYCSACQR